MNINRWINLVALAVILLLGGLVYIFIAEINVKTEQEAALTERDLSLQVATELRQSSNDLSYAARTYVMTEDPKFLDYFFQMLAIRNGDQARPENYNNVYWDFVFANGEKPSPDSDTAISLKELARQANYTEKELKLITEAERIGNEVLGPIQSTAFSALKGKFLDEDGNFARIGLPDRELAKSIIFSQELLDAKAAQMKPLRELVQSVQNRTLSKVVSLEGKSQSLNNWLFILLFITLVMLALLGYLISRRARVQINERRIAQEEAEAENERLNDSVINILQAVSSLSERDLTARAPVTEDVIGTVSDSINLLADETSVVLKDVTNIAGQVSTVSNSVKEQSEQVSQTAEEERKNVQNMIETLFDATQTMNQVAALAEQSNESAAQATEVTESALATVNQTVGGMESIRETISETEKRIKRLGERSQEISGIVNLINTISERTHVLALNASMQAAVAGEAGRGFAVVAEEVQQLAESSRNATEQIATLVNNIQIETNETINTVNRTIGQVVEGSEQAQQAGEQMRKTQQITAELVSRVQNIANASQQQKDMSAQLLEAVQAIGDSTEKTAEQISAQNAGTEELQKAAKQLVESVNVFKLPA